MQGRLAARYNAASDAGWSSQVARRAHNPEVAGSNPAPATRKAPETGPFLFRVLIRQRESCTNFVPWVRFVRVSWSRVQTWFWLERVANAYVPRAAADIALTRPRRSA